jgi:hypothetical protein
VKPSKSMKKSKAQPDAPISRQQLIANLNEDLAP